jgi:hypothetical protein
MKWYFFPSFCAADLRSDFAVAVSLFFRIPITPETVPNSAVRKKRRLAIGEVYGEYA